MTKPKRPGPESAKPKQGSRPEADPAERFIWKPGDLVRTDQKGQPLVNIDTVPDSGDAADP